ncbi:methylenetetrahydrofolate reductase (NADPH) [Promicromonospora sp. AC04]|uniref:methylenetetrahydrofolate reductase n=1 Tax=Promicromonospora sp. AC04 TaxID=2135723 RepID=UPI000D34FBE9|nr:methylenetetrahydrofolate reductase [Promicromonospora sp. AC04]PUB32284.1 methylenetetrahydrofolate reductase (NADPH) [Promicromonospora sp. AC04]
MSIPTARSIDVRGLLTDHSLEMTGKDVPHLLEARTSIPQGTRINVTFLENEDLRVRIRAARTVRDLGFVPVPHISARRFDSEAMLEEYLGALQADGAVDHVFAVGGDPATPHGPYGDALSVIASGVLQRYGVRSASIAGYPDGHPDISEAELWAALTDKAAALHEQGLAGGIITQFGFDVDPVIAWVEEVRRRGITLPIRVGVPGPAGIRRLVRYASRFGIGTSAGIAKKYGFSITNLVGTAGPDKFIGELAERLDPGLHGGVKLHFYTFGGLGATSSWITDRQKEAQR